MKTETKISTYDFRPSENQVSKIAIQGGYGAFHEIAARYYFETHNIELVPCETFYDLFETLKEGKADYAIMAIENIIAGSILPNYSLLLKHKPFILGEIYLRIQQNLLALKGESLHTITEVHSHPMAIAQCRNFFELYPHIKLIESVDTALSAKYIADNKLKNTGAIASALAAEMYNLEIVSEGIETIKANQTRFLALSYKNPDIELKEINKASLCFQLPHAPGSLVDVLNILAEHQINLTKIQSLPVLDRNWEYTFYLDLTFNNYNFYSTALNKIKQNTINLEIMGEYKQGQFILNYKPQNV